MSEAGRCCPLDLQIFEARYLDMVSRCFRQQQGFVVVGLESGSEVGSGNLRFGAIGCEARIIDWQQRDNGLLGIRVLGDVGQLGSTNAWFEGCGYSCCICARPCLIHPMRCPMPFVADSV